MSEQRTGAGLGLDALRPDVAVHRAFPDVTPFEYHRAMTVSHYPYTVLDGRTAVGRVAALRKARVRRPDLSDAEWQRCVLLLHPASSEPQRQNPTELLAAIAAIRPPTAKRSDRPPAGGPPPGTGLTVPRIIDALTSWSGDWPPLQDDLANTELGVTDRRVRQVLGNAGLTWRTVIEKARARR